MSNVKTEGFFGGGKDFESEIREFKGQKVNVNFECGDNIIRVTGGTLAEVGKDFIKLIGRYINVIYFISGYNGPILKKATVVVIPLDRVCDIEKPEK